MGTTNQKVLNKLSQLRAVKEHIDNNPTSIITEVVNKKIANFNLCRVLTEHSLIVNQGNRRNPNWIWNTIIPNVKMAERVLHLQRELERVYNHSKVTRRPRIERVVYAKQSIEDAQVIEEVVEPVVNTKPNYINKRAMYIEAILELNPEIRLHNGIVITFEKDSVLIAKNDKNIKTNDPELFKQIAQMVSL